MANTAQDYSMWVKNSPNVTMTNALNMFFRVGFRVLHSTHEYRFLIRLFCNWGQAAAMPVPSDPLMSWISHCNFPPPHYFFWSTAPVGLTVGSAPFFLKYARLSGQALLTYTVTRTKTPHGAPPPDTCKHSRHDRIAGVCLVGKEKWAEIRSCDPPVCLRLYHSNLTAVILFKQRQMASGKVRKRVHLPLSIYIAISASLTIFHCFLCKKNF